MLYKLTNSIKNTLTITPLYSHRIIKILNFIVEPFTNQKTLKIDKLYILHFKR